MVWLKEKLSIIWYWISYPYYWIKDEIKYRKKLKKLREDDPFIYD
jgi:hypothetical protein